MATKYALQFSAVSVTGKRECDEWTRGTLKECRAAAKHFRTGVATGGITFDGDRIESASLWISNDNGDCIEEV